MNWFAVLLSCLGLLCVAAATDCVPETAKCSKYWERISPHKNLISTEKDLDSWCSKQDRFYKCLEDILLEGKNGNLSYLPTNLLISKFFARDLCSDDSKSRKQLLNNADCINQLNTDFCVLPEYLDIVTPDDDIPSTRCSQAEKTFSCIAATIVLNCGFAAGRVYRTMLKITRYSDEVCGIEISEGIPPCEGNRIKAADREKKLSEIYYGVYDRIGDLLEEDQHENYKSLPEGRLMENMDELVTEAISNAIDSLDKNLVAEDMDDAEHGDSTASVKCSKDAKEFKPYMKNPIITEVFREFLFYNYSGIEYATYWRQPNFTVLDYVICQQLTRSYMELQIFRCRMDYRYKDKDCVSNDTVHDKVTPEFIRSMDPEIPCDSEVKYGPEPEWMKEVHQLYEDKKIRDERKASTVTEAPDLFYTTSTLINLASTGSPDIGTEKWYEIDPMARYNLNSIIPNDLHYEIIDLMMPDMKTYQPPLMNTVKVGNSFYLILYNSDFGKPMENLTCSRLDECHPKGRGLWKCKIVPRQIEACYMCGSDPDINLGVETYARPATSRQEEFMANTTEPTAPAEESDILPSSTPSGESIALVFSGDSDSEAKLEVKSAETELVNEESLMNDEADPKDELDYDDEEFTLSPEQIDENNVRLLVYRALFGKNENSESSEVVYEVEGTNENESEVIIATEDGLIPGNIVFVKDVSDLDETKYAIIGAPTGDA